MKEGVYCGLRLPTGSYRRGRSSHTIPMAPTQTNPPPLPPPPWDCDEIVMGRNNTGPLARSGIAQDHAQLIVSEPSASAWPCF